MGRLATRVGRFGVELGLGWSGLSSWHERVGALIPMGHACRLRGSDQPFTRRGFGCLTRDPSQGGALAFSPVELGAASRPFTRRGFCYLTVRQSSDVQDAQMSHFFCNP